VSDKIFQAWRFPSVYLREFQDITRGYVFSRVIKMFDIWKSSVLPEAIEREMARYGVPSDERIASLMRDEVIVRYVLRTQRQLKNEYGQSQLSLDCGFNIWPWLDGRMYVIPWGNSNYYDGIESVLPSWAQDYHYQNSTDKPDGIEQAEWDERAERWDIICLSDWNRYRLCWKMVDLSPDGLGYVDIEMYYRKLALESEKANEDRIS
jgi:hypothetical protein